MPELDERLGLPSASAMPAYDLCHGKKLAEAGFPELDGDETGANEGEIRHQYMEEEIPLDNISDEGARIAVWKSRQMETQIRAMLGWEENGRKGLIREKRFWLISEGERLFSGKLDYLEIEDDVALILDYKMLMGHHYKASQNRQLKTQAVLVYESHPELRRMFVGLIQPMLDDFTVAEIPMDQLPRDREHLVELCDKISKPNAPRTAGSYQCKYCRALASCPEATEHVMKVINE